MKLLIKIAIIILLVVLFGDTPLKLLIKVFEFMIDLIKSVMSSV